MLKKYIMTLFLLAVVLCFSVGSCHDCAFIPGPISESDYTAVVKVDCDKQHAADAGLAANTGDLSYTRDLLVYLYNCPTVPGRMFFNVTAYLSTVTLVSVDSEQMLEGTFDSLENIAELRLEGFQSLHTLSKLTFRPLRSLERLVLIRFGAHRLTYAELGAALFQLSGTPLRMIVMHKIHSARNEKTLPINELLQMENVTVHEVTFSNNVITGISGRLSVALPDLRYICIGGDFRYHVAISALFDAFLYLPKLRECVAYSYPRPATMDEESTGGINILDFDLAIRAVLSFMFSRCYSGLRFSIAPSIRRVTIRNIQLFDFDVQKPICFDNSNNLEYLDYAGSPFPRSMTPLTGLDKLKLLSLQNTGIILFPDDFLSYFPELEVINLVQLSIGPWLKHINSNFFGSCQTLTEVHLGDCQLTTTPPSAFVLLPSLKTLNLSSNLLHTFDINLRNNSNLTRLNLSGNAISTLSEDTLVQLKAIAEQRQQTGDRLTLDLRMNPLRCLCNSTQFVSQLQDWVRKQEVNVPGFEEYRCLYTNGSEVAMCQVDVDQLVTQCSVLSEIKNGSDCSCDDALRHRLELVRLSLDGYFCRNSDGRIIPMIANQAFLSCFDSYVVFAAAGCVTALAVIMTTIIFVYRHRDSKTVVRISKYLCMTSIARFCIRSTHAMARRREDPNSFEADVFLYIQDNDLETVERQFEAELVPFYKVVRSDDFQPGLKLDRMLENIGTCRWLLPVLTQNFVDDEECFYFLACAQYHRPHAIVPIVWTRFHFPEDIGRTIGLLLDIAKPVEWPGDDVHEKIKCSFWNTVRRRTGNTN